LTAAPKGIGEGQENRYMSRVETKPITNWCAQAKPTEQGLCGVNKAD
jgi:hypothetical protein